jgi:hypothetical protein
MNEMVERTAAAILKEAGLLNSEEIHDDLTNWLAISRSYARRYARAVLESAREPTESMLIAARDWSAAKYGRPIGNDAAVGCLHAMIDAALKDEP